MLRDVSSDSVPLDNLMDGRGYLRKPFYARADNLDTLMNSYLDEGYYLAPQSEDDPDPGALLTVQFVIRQGRLSRTGKSYSFKSSYKVDVGDAVVARPTYQGRSAYVVAKVLGITEVPEGPWRIANSFYKDDLKYIVGVIRFIP
jgi:hypothetical protein